MENLIIGIVIGVVAGAVAGYVLAAARAGKAAAPAPPPPPAVPPAPPKPSGAALRMLALLQAEARLVDFLLEDIAGASDAQIGQAVREVHKKAQAALKQHAVVETILGGSEGDTTTVPKGFDPSAIRVVGNVTGEPPFTGRIHHPGWRVLEEDEVIEPGDA